MRCYIYKLGLICVLLSGIVDRCFARSFSVQRVGDGKQAVILIPGFACSGEVWKQTADTLRNDYTCYVLTMPGFAGIAPEADPSFDNWAKEIVDFIRSESIDRPILIGHSMGGGLALKIASAQENLVKSIVVVDALPCLAAVYDPGFQSRKISDDEFAEAGARLLDMSEESFRRQAHISATSLTADSLRYDELVRWSMSSDRRTYAKMYYDYYNVDLRPVIKNISVPVLVLLEHPFKKISYIVEQQFAGISDIRLEYADKGLHFIMFDDWKWYIQHIIDFLKY